MNILTPGLLSLALSAPALALTGPSVRPAPRDTYVLSRGHFVSMDGSIDRLEALRDEYGDEFLWVRRGGVRYLVRDSKVLEEAMACFERVSALEPEQDALQHKEESLDREEEALDRRQERLERASEIGEDDENAPPPDPAVATEQRDIERRQTEIETRQRELEVVERDLDRREDVLEKEAEAALWKLVDRAIREGAAIPLSR